MALKCVYVGSSQAQLAAYLRGLLAWLNLPHKRCRRSVSLKCLAAFQVPRRYNPEYHIAITVLDIIHRPITYSKDDVSDTGFCLRLQVEPTQVGPIERTSFYRSRSYFTTDDLSVSVSWYQAPLWDLRPDITSCRHVAVWKLRSCFCGAPSLTRGRICTLQCNHLMVRMAQNP
jgi:hypothetical protein